MIASIHELMTVAKYWFKHDGAVPAVMSSAELEFDCKSE